MATAMSRSYQIPNLRCGECNAIRVYIASGVVCPNGHGKIHPADRANFNQAVKKMLRDERLAALPKLIKRSGKGSRHSYYVMQGKSKDYRTVVTFEIEGMAGIFRKATADERRDAAERIVIARSGERTRAKLISIDQDRK